VDRLIKGRYIPTTPSTNHVSKHPAEQLPGKSKVRATWDLWPRSKEIDALETRETTDNSVPGYLRIAPMGLSQVALVWGRRSEECRRDES